MALSHLAHRPRIESSRPLRGREAGLVVWIIMLLVDLDAFETYNHQAQSTTWANLWGHL